MDIESLITNQYVAFIFKISGHKVGRPAKRDLDQKDTMAKMDQNLFD